MIIGGVRVSAALPGWYFPGRVSEYMYYQICPRCQFRSPASKTVCATCGKALPKNAPDRSDNSASRTANRVQKGGFWKSMFGIADVGDAGEKAHDEPALGET